MKIKAKLQRAKQKVKETVVDYGADIVYGTIIIGMVGGTAYMLVKSYKDMRTQVYQPVEDGYYVSDEEVQGMIDAGNKWLDEYRTAEKADQEGEH